MILKTILCLPPWPERAYSLLGGRTWEKERIDSFYLLETAPIANQNISFAFNKVKSNPFYLDDWRKMFSTCQFKTNTTFFNKISSALLKIAKSRREKPTKTSRPFFSFSLHPNAFRSLQSFSLSWLIRPFFWSGPLPIQRSSEGLFKC